MGNSWASAFPNTRAGNIQKEDNETEEGKQIVSFGRISLTALSLSQSGQTCIPFSMDIGNLELMHYIQFS